MSWKGMVIFVLWMVPQSAVAEECGVLKERILEARAELQKLTEEASGINEKLSSVAAARSAEGQTQQEQLAAVQARISEANLAVQELVKQFKQKRCK